MHQLPRSGADLGFLEWWGCNTNAHKNFRPRPLNKNHTHFNHLKLPSNTESYIMPSRHSNKSGCTTAHLESCFTPNV